jgi:hypothetical protein
MSQQKSNRNLLYKYLGFGFQLILLLALTVYAGIWLDKKLNFKTPLLVWILPLLVISATIFKVVKDTSKK